MSLLPKSTGAVILFVWLFGFICWLAVVGGLIWAAIHFISKYW